MKTDCRKHEYNSIALICSVHTKNSNVDWFQVSGFHLSVDYLLIEIILKL